MAIQTGDVITKLDIINRFNSRVRDWVTANTNWISSTIVWNTTVGNVTANSTAGGSTQMGNPGGTYNRTTSATAAPDSIQEANLNTVIGADKDSAGKIVKVLKDFMILYANNHKINLINTGNIPPGNDGTVGYTGVARLNGAPAATVSAITADVDAAAIANGLQTGQIINATKINNFIESCRTIWTNRSLNTAIEDFYYNYCHSSCHTSYTCYNSRGRR